MVHLLRPPLTYLAAIVAVTVHLFLSIVLPNLNINMKQREKTLGTMLSDPISDAKSLTKRERDLRILQTQTYLTY